MKLHFIGRSTYEHGKKLMNLLGRLKGYGVGRIVYRQHYKTQYDEPTYYIITGVKPNMADPSGKNQDRETHTKVYARTIFRGEDKGIRALSAHWKEDWRLVPKNEEHLWTAVEHPERPRKVVKEFMRFPPFYEYRLKQKLPIGVGMPYLPTCIRQARDNRAILELLPKKNKKKKRSSPTVTEEPSN